jgi:hypothetical protein
MKGPVTAGPFVSADDRRRYLRRYSP